MLAAVDGVVPTLNAKDADLAIYGGRLDNDNTRYVYTHFSYFRQSV
jgi:hypothetical protein